MPPAPVQVSVYVSAPDVAGVCVDVPEIACGPDHAPDAAHDVAFVDDHVSVDDAPRPTFDWLKVSVTVGDGTTGVGAVGVGVVLSLLPPQDNEPNVSNAAIGNGKRRMGVLMGMLRRYCVSTVLASTTNSHTGATLRITTVRNGALSIQQLLIRDDCSPT